MRIPNPASLLLLLAGPACNPFAGGKYTAFQSEDGRFQVTAPRSWEFRRYLDDSAVIQIAGSRQGVCLIVDVEAKKDAEDRDLGDYADRVRERFMEPLRSSSPTSSREIAIDGMRGVESEFEGTAGRNRFFYLFLAVETGEHYAQLIAWTFASRREENLPLMRSVAYSFREAR